MITLSCDSFVCHYRTAILMAIEQVPMKTILILKDFITEYRKPVH